MQKPYPKQRHESLRREAFIPNDLPIWIISMEEDHDTRFTRLEQELTDQFTNAKCWTSFRNPVPQIGLGLAYKAICNQAYLTQIEKIKDANDQYKTDKTMVLTFEDDCVLQSQHAMTYFWNCYKDLPRGWDVYLGGAYGTILEDEHHTPFIKRVKQFSGTHMMLLSMKAIKHIMWKYDPYFKPKKGEADLSHIDRYLASTDLRIYSCHPMVATQEFGVPSRITNLNHILPDRFVNQELLTRSHYLTTSHYFNRCKLYKN